MSKIPKEQNYNESKQINQQTTMQCQMTKNKTKMLKYLGPMFRLDNRRRFGLTCADFGRAEVIFGFNI